MKLTFLLLCILTCQIIFSQRTQYQLSAGVKRSALWNNSASYSVPGEEGGSTFFPFGAITLAHFQFCYSNRINSNWRYNIGLAYSDKGFRTNVYSTFALGWGTNTYYHNKKHTQYRIGIPLGISYSFKQMVKTKYSIQLFLTPEAKDICIDSYNPIQFSIQLFLHCERTYKKNFFFHLSPYIESALQNYAVTQYYKHFFPRYPYGIGILAGIGISKY